MKTIWQATYQLVDEEKVSSVWKTKS